MVRRAADSFWQARLPCSARCARWSGFGSRRREKPLACVLVWQDDCTRKPPLSAVVPAMKLASRTTSLRANGASLLTDAPADLAGMRQPASSHRPTLADVIEQMDVDLHEPVGKRIFRALRQAIFVGAM